MPIGLCLSGRLGNHLFQYAFIAATARKNGTGFFIEGLDSLHYFKLSQWGILRNQVTFYQVALTYWFRKLLGHKPEGYLGLKQMNQAGYNCPEKVSENLGDNTFYKGYFQSEIYFRDQAFLVRQQLQLKKKWKKAFLQEKRSFLPEEYLAVHIRRGDYKDWEIDYLEDKDFRLPKSYFRNAFKKISADLTLPLVVLCDDEQFVDEVFPGQDYQYEYNSPIIDFQILTHAKALIISNSTFSWWGAYLNTNEPETIIAPKYWLGFKQEKEYPVGITNVQFNWMEVPKA